MLAFKKCVLTLFVVVFSISLKAQTVFKTPSGAKYHLSSCRMVKNVSEEITISRAKELGLQPCKICQPDNINGQIPIVHKAQGQSTTVQCKGLTKAGGRCKHMTSIANGYCFQHQPK
jgi:Family of unknown function (DUF5763)